MSSVTNWIRAHPFTTLGAVSLIFMWLTLTGALPLTQPWRAFMLPAYLTLIPLSSLVYAVLPFARGPQLAAAVAWLMIVLPLFFLILLGLDKLLVWRSWIGAGPPGADEGPPARSTS